MVKTHWTKNTEFVTVLTGFATVNYILCTLTLSVYLTDFCYHALSITMVSKLG